MRAWHIYLAIAKRINLLLEMEENSFYTGVLIADLDKKIGKRASHFQKQELIQDAKVLLPSYTDYIKRYEKKLDNPVYMGYLVHLMIDYFFNKNTFSNYYVVENKIIIGSRLNNGNVLLGDMSSRRRLRINDYTVFDNYIKENGGYGKITYTEGMYKNLKKFRLIHVEKDDIFDLIETINQEEKENIVRKIFKKKYKLYTRDEMEKCFEDCIVFIEEYLKENIKGCKPA